MDFNHHILALSQFLENHPQVNQIIFHLDLDKVGRQATRLIIESMKSKMPIYNCYDQTPKYYKDMNDSLCLRIGITSNKSRLNEKEICSTR